MTNTASQASAEVAIGEVAQAELPMYFPANRVKRVATRMGARSGKSVLAGEMPTAPAT